MNNLENILKQKTPLCYELNHGLDDPRIFKIQENIITILIKISSKQCTLRNI